MGDLEGNPRGVYSWRIGGEREGCEFVLCVIESAKNKCCFSGRLKFVFLLGFNSDAGCARDVTTNESGG